MGYTSPFRGVRKVIALAMVTSLTACGENNAVDEGGSLAGGEPVTRIEERLSYAVSEVLTTSYIAPGFTGTNLSAECPAGTVLVGGGFNVARDVRVYSSRSNYNKWLVTAINLGAATGFVQVAAECLSGTTGSGFLAVSAVTTVGPRARVCATAVCPATTLPTGGGFSSNLPFVVDSTSGSETSWSVCGTNVSTSQSTTLQTIANCLGGVRGGIVPQRAIQYEVQPGTTLLADTLYCDTGYASSGGVFIRPADPATTFLTGTLRTPQKRSQWRVFYANFSNAVQSIYPQAQCFWLY